LAKINYHIYYSLIKGLSFGKKLNDAIYVFYDSLIIKNPGLAEIIESVEKKFNIDNTYNVIKFSRSSIKISFLKYPDFLNLPHPTLYSSITVNFSKGTARTINYSNSLNPPILHRKETMVHPEHPLFSKFKALTKAEEAAELYENTKVIGYKKSWEALINKKGLKYAGHSLVKIGTKCDKITKKKLKIERHKTAIARYNFSRPIQSLLEYNLFQDGITLFDYGCGQGDDVKGLKKMGLLVSGWDPNYKPDEPKKEADIVNLGFVLNVIEDQIERKETLIDAFSFAKKLLVVSCQIASSNTKNLGKTYKDGILTQKKTFQKYFKQDELQNFIEKVLDTTAIAITPGIFYVFRSPIDQQEFISQRNKREINWEEISRKLYPDRAERLKLKRQELYDQNKELLDAFWNRMLDLGRIPQKSEFEGYEELRNKIGTQNTAKRIFIEKFGENTLKEAFAIRRNDLLVYLALANFRTRIPFKYLSKTLQTDIKTFLGGYKNGIDESRDMLFSIGNPEVITELCAKTNFGFFDHKALYIHRSLINDLHPILRIYIGCAGILYGDLKNADIIKIHKSSGKVTLLRYDDFEGKNLPELQERIKINLRQQRIDIFNHQVGPNQQLLYFKDSYVTNEHPKYPKWKKFADKLREFGFNDKDPIGPSKQEFIDFIKEKDLTINLNKKRKQQLK
jgi:DNA phosphorothioation-associated putative methyltransferase